MRHFVRLSRVVYRSVFGGPSAAFAFTHTSPSSPTAPVSVSSVATNPRPRFACLVATHSGFAKDMRFGVSAAASARRRVYGEDACFIAHHSTADVLGVADGVGGWRQYGVDPSSFSQSLMRECGRLVREGQFDAAAPARLIADAYAHVQVDSKRAERAAEPIGGSSTVCIVALERDSQCLHTANLGDSGFIVLRNGNVVHRSVEQTHYFNTPFQIAVPPKDYPSTAFLNDSPESADTCSFAVQPGDLIVVATDGLFDNIPSELIENELRALDLNLSTMDSSEQMDALQSACNSLALQARRLMFDENHKSPFSTKAIEFGFDARGGKPDDITIIVAVVSAMDEVSPGADEP